MSTSATDLGDEGPFGSRPPADRPILRRFISDGRLATIPAKLSVRRVVLEWLVDDFALDRDYTEQMVNLVLGQRHPDTAALRRYLVDEGLMERSSGIYRRVVAG